MWKELKGIRRYVSGELSFAALQDLVLDADTASSDALHALVDEVETVMAEYTRGDISREHFKAALSEILREFDTSVVVVAPYGSPATVTSSATQVVRREAVFA